MALQARNSNVALEPLASNAEWVHESSAEVEIKVYHGHTGAINTCQVIEEKNWLITGSNDNTARIWNLQSGRPIHLYKLNHDMADIPNICINQEGTRLYSCSWDKTVRCFDVETGKQLWKGVHEQIVTCCQVAPDGKSVCSGTDLDSMITIWDAASGLVTTRMPNVHESTITSCQFSAASDRIVTTSMDKTAKIYDLVSQRSTITLSGHRGSVSRCAFNRHERVYATCSWDKNVLLFDATTGGFRREGPRALPKVHEGSVAACHMSADGKLLVTGGYDLRVVLWDLEEMAHKVVLRGHTDWINDVCITNDNKWIVSVSSDCDIRMWHVEHCDNIKLVMDNSKTLKILLCHRCGKNFSSNKIRRDESEIASAAPAVLLCVFCRLEQKQNVAPIQSYSLDDYDKPALNEAVLHK